MVTMVEDREQKYADFRALAPPAQKSAGGDLRDLANNEYIPYV